MVMRWFFLLIVSASAVWAQPPAPNTLIRFEFTAVVNHIGGSGTPGVQIGSTVSGHYIFDLGSTGVRGPEYTIYAQPPSTQWLVSAGAQSFSNALSSIGIIDAHPISGDRYEVRGDDFALILGSPKDSSVIPSTALSNKPYPLSDFGGRTVYYYVGENGFQATLTSLQAVGPRIGITKLGGLTMVSGAAATQHLPALVASGAVDDTYTVRNFGSAALGNMVVSKSGADSSHFLLTVPATDSLAPGASTTFSVSFAPTSSGSRTAQISITSNDTNNSPFIINLYGFGLGEDLDSDGDSLNDAAEFTMSALGFDWQSRQPTLVTALYSNANRANLFTQLQYDANRTNGQTDVMNNPAAFNLFDSTQYEAHRISGVAQGKAEVTSNPTAYSLFTESSIMDMNLGSLMLKKRADANALDLELTIETKDNFTTDGWQVAERITRLVSMVGVQRQFLRVRADAPYVAPNVKMLAHPTLGNILTDGAGRVLYFFTSDTPGGNPMFSGSSWPYVSVPAAPKADASVTATIASSSFGRSNGPFLTINTRPAYTYAGDTTAGQATGHGAGGVWYTIKADGTINQ